MNTKTYLLLGLMAVFMSACNPGKKNELKPPHTPRKMVVDEYHGIKVEDPYQYIENLTDPDVQKWFHAQNDYARQVLDQIPGRDAIYNRIKELDASVPYYVGSLKIVGERYFYLKRRQGQDQYALYYRDKIEWEEKLIFDPQVYNKDDKKYAIERYYPSPNGTVVAISTSANGSERGTMYILNCENTMVVDQINDVRYPSCDWQNEESFVYNYHSANSHSTHQKFVWEICKFHTIGTNPDLDNVVFSKELYPNLPLDSIESPCTISSKNSNYTSLYFYNGVEDNLRILYKKKTHINKTELPWMPICNRSDNIITYELYKNKIFMLKSNDDNSYQVLEQQLFDHKIGDRIKLFEVKQGEIIESITAQDDHLFIKIFTNGKSMLYIKDLASSDEPSLVKLAKGVEYISSILKTDQPNELVLKVKSYTQPYYFCVYNFKQNSFKKLGLKASSKYDQQEIVRKDIEAVSHDGVKIPMTIIYKKGLKRNGKNPVWMLGYGSYGITKKPFFSWKNYAWFEMGGIMAIAHIRGGGYRGKSWHLEGKSHNKPNTWKDFIACAEKLIEDGYTSKKKIAGQGRSAGGITIGRAITERPDLFAVAIACVGSLNPLRGELQPTGPANITEFGTFKDPKQFKDLLEMDAYHHIQHGETYPAIIITTGMQDSRVAPFYPAKFAAKMQYATGSDSPVIFKVDFQGGHFITDDPNTYMEDLADRFAFMLSQMEHPGFIK